MRTFRSRTFDPIGYNEIVEGLKAQSEQHEEFLKGIQERISEKLREAHINNTISARVKHIYSIYRKMYAQHKTINEIYDICAVRVIVDTVADCYNVLGYVHDLYKPIPGRFKDYISTPEAERLPVAPHDRHRPRRHPVRDPDPHGRDAQDGGIRRCGALEVQAGSG